MVATELGCSLDYVLYEMNYNTFIEYQNWFAMYKFGYKRTWEESSRAKPTKVWDCANENFIDYVETERGRYVWEEKRNCHTLPKGN